MDGSRAVNKVVIEIDSLKASAQLSVNAAGCSAVLSRLCLKSGESLLSFKCGHLRCVRTADI